MKEVKIDNAWIFYATNGWPVFMVEVDIDYRPWFHIDSSENDEQTPPDPWAVPTQTLMALPFY